MSAFARLAFGQGSNVSGQTLRFVLTNPSGACSVYQSAELNIAANPPLLWGCPLATQTWTLIASASNLTLQLSGSTVGTQPILNLISGTGINQVCSNNSGLSRFDCTPAVDTAYVLSRPTEQAGTDRSIVATSGGAGINFTAMMTPTLAIYTQNSTFMFLPQDANCAANATLNIDGIGTEPIKVLSGTSLVAIGANDAHCIQGIPHEIIAVGSPVSAFYLP